MTPGAGVPRDAVVVGGGLAGITAALRLADAGVSVTVLEAKPRLGGLTTSFTRASRVGQLTVDTGQHVFLRCCTAYLDLLDRLGVRDQVRLQPRLDIPVVGADGRRARLRRDGLPVLAGIPLHLARSLLGYRLLSLRDRLAASRAIRALGHVDPADPVTDATGFGVWLARHGQSHATVELLWELIGIATLNARADDASLALAATVFRLGLLTDPGAADIGWAAVPLGRLHGDAALTALGAAGADVRTRARAVSVRAEQTSSRRWTVQSADGESIDADAVVIAAEPTVTERLLPEGAVSLPAGWSDRLGATPIINAHFVLDRPVLGEPMLALPGSPLQFLFDRTDSSNLSAAVPGAQHVVASISAANALAGHTVAALREDLTPHLHRALPAAKSAQLLDFFVTREPHATWRQAPGQAAHRPPAATRMPGLVLAGAHTDTGWPATMEGAVRSGNTAAGLLVASTGQPARPMTYRSPAPTSTQGAAA